MGGICCIAARDKDVSERSVGNAMHRNFRCSPSWSFNWDNRRRVAGEIDVEDSSYQLSSGIEDSHKTLAQDVTGTNSVVQPSDPGSESSCFMEVGSPDTVSLSASKDENSLRLSFSTPRHIQRSLAPPGATPSRTARRSPARQLLRQVSDSRILEMRSPSCNSFSGGRRSSCMLSSCNNDPAAASNCGSSSDSWSVRTFSELVASSRRERWSFESEQFGSTAFGKIATGSSNGFSSSPASLDPQTCAACSELLASWRRGELSVVAVLSCGHVYHADCLEAMTADIDRYDPACLICHRVVEKQISNARSKVVADVGSVVNSIGGPRSAASTSLAKPFLRRHFSFGPKTSRSRPENRVATKRKIFRKLSRRFISANR